MDCILEPSQGRQKGKAKERSKDEQPIGTQKKLKIKKIGAFTLDVKSVLHENLHGILGGMQC
jgi:hypothetical protein